MYDDLFTKLVKTFGFGRDPQRRESLYQKLVSLCNQHGDAVYRHVRSCAVEAREARNPDRYFCKAIAARLREHGFGALDEFDVFDEQHRGHNKV